MENLRNLLYEEKYRPKDLSELICSDYQRQFISSILESKNIPNLLLYGPKGMGKTTVARFIPRILGADYIFINASEERGIEVIRDKMFNFSITKSNVKGLPKIIILDEADNMSSTSLPALRGFIEQYSSNVRFIFTANYKSKLPEPIVSRLHSIDFSFDDKTKKELLKVFAKRVIDILKSENVEITEDGKKVFIEFIKQYFPDMRKTLVQLQGYVQAKGKVDEGIIFLIEESKYVEFFQHLKEKNFAKVRDWIYVNSVEFETLVNELYNRIDSIFLNASIANAILIINQHMVNNSFCFNKEINCVSMAIMLMSECEFK